VIEGRVGPGRIILSGFDLTTGLDKRVVARQLRRSLLDYMAGPGFKPSLELDLDRIFALSAAFTGGVVSATDSGAAVSGKNSGAVKKQGKSALDVVQAELDQFDKMTGSTRAAKGAAAAFDLNWNSKWNLAGAGLPQEVQIDFGYSAKLGGLLYVPPKADGIRASKFDVYVSDDSGHWGEPVARFTAKELSAREVTSKWWFTIVFDKPCAGRFMKIVVPDDPANRNGLLSVGEFEPVFHW
ncbi:MAG: discoidin domain-containing protein, partial [Kiritimatiellales bacterium]